MLIFCDLDGVLIDSRRECLEILKHIFPKNFENKNYIINFNLNRGLVDPPEDFLVLNNLICKEKTKKKISKKLFNNSKKNITQKELIYFKKNFFEIRKNLINKSFNKWINLNTLTSFAQRLKKFKQLNIVIITTKNLEASKSICNFFKFNFEKIIANENLIKKTKGDLIKDYLDNYNIRQAIFIDDSSKHLKSCTDNRVIKLFAYWGYNKTSIYKKFQLPYFKKLIKN